MNEKNDNCGCIDERTNAWMIVGMTNVWMNELMDIDKCTHGQTNDEGDDDDDAE